jgi:hypothetical protein
MTLGLSDLKNISLPAAWDNTELNRLRLRDGTTYEAIIRDINDALSLINAGLTGGYLGKLFSLTTEAAVEYRTGASNGFEDHTEYTQPDAKRADTTGHMLPIKKLDRKLGWTTDFLEECRLVQIDADVASMAEDAVNAWEKSIWVRLFKLAEETGKNVGLGTSGVSVPFADGGVGTITWTPPPHPSRQINAFDSTHNHFLRLNGITQANLETAVAHLWEHGYDAPYELIVSLADLGSWQNTTNVTGFVPKANALIQYGQLNDLALVDAAVYQGAVTTKYGSVQLYANARIPTGYWGVTKSFGALDQRNPLRVRWDDLYGFGVRLVTASVNLYPLVGAIGLMKHGVGVGEDRAAAVLVKNDSSGDYTTPTIT